MIKLYLEKENLMAIFDINKQKGVKIIPNVSLVKIGNSLAKYKMHCKFINEINNMKK